MKFESGLRNRSEIVGFGGFLLCVLAVGVHQPALFVLGILVLVGAAVLGTFDRARDRRRDATLGTGFEADSLPQRPDSN
jgi:hypothetical protein